MIPTVICDLDGVIADFNGYVQQMIGPPVDPHAYLGSERWPGKEAEFESILHDPNTYSKLLPVRGAKKGIDRLANIYPNIVYVTARDYGNKSEMVEQTSKWLSDWNFQSFPLYVTGVDEKAALIQSLIGNKRNGFAIDDSPYQIMSLANRGLSVIIFTQPWNEHLIGIRMRWFDEPTMGDF